MESLDKKRLRKLGDLGQDRPLVAGSLSRIERRDARGKVTVYHLLTFKEAGKTRSVYVPKDLVKEVQSWIRNHRKVKQLMADISTISIAIIQQHAPQKRAARSGPVAAAKRPGKANAL